MSMKYITIEDKYGNEVAVLFSETMAHVEVLQAQKPLGAGFCEIMPSVDEPGKLVIHCHGQSSLLNVKSRNEEDEKVVARTLFPDKDSRRQHVENRLIPRELTEEEKVQCDKDFIDFLNATCPEQPSTT